MMNLIFVNFKFLEFIIICKLNIKNAKIFKNIF